MKLNKKLLALCFCTSFLSADNINYMFNYFGNLTLNTLDKSGYDFRSYQIDDIDNSVSYQSYSKLGGQVVLNKSDFDFTSQVIAREYKNELETDISWLNLKYTKENFAFRVGRMQLPIFLKSDSLDIDYVNIWAKAPVEVYGIFPVKYYDGVELMYQKAFDESYFEFQFTPYGKLKQDVSILDSIGEVSAKLGSIKNAVATYEISNFTFKSSFTQGKLTIPLGSTQLSTLTNTLNNLGFSSLANKYSFNKKDLKFYSFGINYDTKNFFIDSEIAKMESKSFLPNMIGYYIMAGYKYNKFTPFVMYAENKNDKSFYSEDELVTNSTDPVVAGTVAQVRAGLEQELYKMNSSQKTSSIGLRYDIKKGLALKFQVDRITTKNYGTPSTSGNYERLGFLAREKGVGDEPVYLFTLGLGFAF